MSLKAIDLFSGAGGLSLGAIKAGINVSIAIEYDKYSAATFKKNHNETIVIQDDIRNIDPLKLNIEKPFIIFGGPPCQGFSVSNRKTRTLDNINNTLYSEFIRFVDKLQPEWFLFENVEGLTNFNNGQTLKTILERFITLGYKTTHKVLYASDYGVPQHRNRFFIVGNRLGFDFQFPEPIGIKVTVGDAFVDLPKLASGDNIHELCYNSERIPSDYAISMKGESKVVIQNIVSKNTDLVLERYKHIKQGQNWRAIPEHLMSNYKNKNNCHSGIYKRLKWDEPSVVISNYRKNMLIHPLEDRGLSVREAARLQSFPDNFIFEGSVHYIQQQIGNAVPPLLAEAIFNKILSYKNVE
ncbi:MAG: DNA cytosine methyltransferase [Paludibacter sp.]|nr:DNA cytosine methyltransferase [Paludibacter sp.]